MTRPKDLVPTVTFSNFFDPVTCLNLEMDFVSRKNLVVQGKLNFKQIVIHEMKAI